MKFENVKYAEALKVHLHDNFQLPILQNTTPGELSREYEDGSERYESATILVNCRQGPE